jgi:hypothetical protein
MQVSVWLDNAERGGGKISNEIRDIEMQVSGCEARRNIDGGGHVTTRRSVLIHSTAAALALTLPRGAFAQAFPAKAHQDHRAVPARRASRYRGADRAGRHGKIARPAGHRRERGRGGWRPRRAARQAIEPDGYTLLQAASPHTTNAAVKPQGNVDLIRDFVSIGQTGNSVYTLCASKELGLATLGDIVARAKAKPGELKIGSVGIGSAHHLIAEMLKSAAGIELTHVPYRGEGPGHSRPDRRAHRSSCSSPPPSR